MCRSLTLIEKSNLRNFSKVKFKKKRFPEIPGFELGNSDPIANHITTRPRSIYRIMGKNFAITLISNMIYFIRADSALGW